MPMHELKPLDEIDRPHDDVETVLEGDETLDAYFEGEGDTDYICSQCRETVIKSIKKGQVVNLGLACPECGAELYIPDH